MNEMRTRIGASQTRPIRPLTCARSRNSDRHEHLLDLLMIAGLLAVAHEPLVWLFAGRDALAEFLDVCGSTLTLAGVVVILLLFARCLLTERFVLARTYAQPRR